ncbi:hypothetical protein P261_00156 [Lachnospiraceae bacterium TWA4]|nr:hypothetical protein P261_00156 [Lachnospiraceae bacterium TWA4]
MNQLEQEIERLIKEEQEIVITRIDADKFIESEEQEQSIQSIICLTYDKKLEGLLDICKKINNQVLIIEVPFHRVFSYPKGLPGFVEDFKAAGVSGFHILDLPYEEQGQLLVHLLDEDGPCLLQEIAVSSGDRVPSILQTARGFVWCNDKGYSESLSVLPGDYKEYYLYAVGAVAMIPVILDFNVQSKEELNDYLENANGYILNK